MDFSGLLNFVLLALGFGFVIFWHELGHFLAAKWAGVRVEQFAVGFGQAILSWRKGLGFRVGTSALEYEKRKQEDPRAGEAISPTEYRLNWIPLGGYVKMLGQEDLGVADATTAPDSYTNKSVGKRMVIISAGVVMNVILAAILFMALFLYGFNAPAPVVGGVFPGSPAQRAGLQPGDTIVSIDGATTYDFTQVVLNSALLGEGERAPIVIQPRGTTEPDEQRTVEVIPAPNPSMPGIMGIGVEPAISLTAVQLPQEQAEQQVEELRTTLGREPAVRPGELVVAVAGEQVQNDEFYKLSESLAASGGQPVTITVKTRDGKLAQRQVNPTLAGVPTMNPAAASPLAGLQPRVQVAAVAPDTPAAQILQPGDVILEIREGEGLDRRVNPGFPAFAEFLQSAGERGKTVRLTVLRDGETVELEPVSPTSDYKLGFNPILEQGRPVVAGTTDDTPAAAAAIPAGATITAVNGESVSTWFDVWLALNNAAQPAADTAEPTTQPTTTPAAAATGTTVTLTLERDGQSFTSTMELGEEARQAVTAAQVTAAPGELAFLQPLKIERDTNNPLEALWWGMIETKDLILQFYLTLQRIFEGSVGANNMMGPAGILGAGAGAASQGFDVLLWFLAIISANLAVVNFLPIPILDGGHMVFLIAEKITGKPPSPRIQAAAMTVGLVLIASLVIFVTYNDIQRMFL